MLFVASTVVTAWGAWQLAGCFETSLPAGRQRGLRAALAFALAAMLALFGYFAWLVNFGPPGTAYLAVHAAAMVALGGAAHYQTRRGAAPAGNMPWAPRVPTRRTLWLALATATLFAVPGMALQSWRYPHGTDDALEIWNLHARFLYQGGDQWQLPFLEARQSQILFSLHPDYPLGLPSLIAWGWTAWGAAAPWIPALLAAAFTAATVLLAGGALAALRGSNQALLAATALVGTVPFLIAGASQYADVPLGFCFLGALVALACAEQSPRDLRGRWVMLAGAMMGLSAWLKNEGLLALVVFAAALAGSAWWRRGARGALADTARLALGLLPWCLLIGWFKLHLACTNDLVAGQSQSTLAERLTDLARWRLIADYYVRTYFDLGKPLAVAIPLCWLVGGRHARWMRSQAALGGGLWMAGMLAGYFLVYVTTPIPLQRHLDTSLARLFLQLWPALVFLVLLTSASIDDPRHEAARSWTPTLAGFARAMRLPQPAPLRRVRRWALGSALWVRSTLIGD